MAAFPSGALVSSGRRIVALTINRAALVIS
jgi:hypothetical protein